MKWDGLIRAIRNYWPRDRASARSALTNLPALPAHLRSRCSIFRRREPAAICGGLTRRVFNPAASLESAPPSIAKDSAPFQQRVSLV